MTVPCKSHFLPNDTLQRWMREEDLERAILEKDKTISKEELEKLVEEKLRNSPFLTRRGALLIILEEKRLAKELLESREFGEYIPIAQLTSGLQSVNVAGRVLGVATVEGEMGQKYAKLRIADNSGAVDVFGDVEALTGVLVGDVIGLKNCSVFAQRRRKSVALRATAKTLVEKPGREESFPSFEKLFQGPGEALSTKAEYADVSAVVVYDTPRLENEDLNFVMMTDGKEPYLLIAYREHSHVFKDSSGKRFYATNLLVKHGTFYTVSDTCVTFSHEEPEIREKIMCKAIAQLAVKTIGTCVDGVPVGYAEGRLFRLPTLKNPSTASRYLVANSFIIAHREIPHLFFNSLQQLEDSDNVAMLPEFDGDLWKVEGRLINHVISVEILRKTDVSYVETKFGRRPFTRFWLKVGDKVVAGVSWGEAAVKIGEIPEGTKTRFAFPIIKANKFGELEISIDSMTAIC